MATDRWDGNIHYYDYEPNEIPREADRDAEHRRDFGFILDDQHASRR